MARASPAPIIRTMTELARPAAAEPAPLGYSDALKTQAERRAELRRMRTIATLLLVLMAAIFLVMRRAPPDWVWAPYLGAFAEAGMVGACADWFAVVALFRRPLGCRSPIPPSCRKTSGASARRSGASSPTTSSPHASRSRASRRSTRSGLRRDGSRTSATRGRSRPAPDAPFPYALDLVPKAAIDEWVALAARRGIEAVPAAPLASRVLSILWAQGAGQTLLDQGARFRETRSRATRRRSSGTCRKNPRAASPNGSTT